MKLTFNKKYFIWALALLGAELLIATVFSSMGFIRGYIGDVLVVILLYYLVLSFVKVKHKDKLIWGIFAFAVAVEVMQYLGVATYFRLHERELGVYPLGQSLFVGRCGVLRHWLSYFAIHK